MIKTITLQNWKTHYNTQLEFTKGTNVIVGKMGAGKSSVMDAISFALYGTFPSLSQRKVTLDETIMQTPMKQEQSIIKLEFEYDNKEYIVERIIKRKGTNEATLRFEGKIIAGPKTTEVTKKISEILETSYELFSRAIYSEQNQIDFFLKLSPAQRKEKFDELLGLDKYETVRTNAVTLANRIKKLSEDRKNFLIQQTEKTNPQQLEEYEKKITEKEKELEEKRLNSEKILKTEKELEETLKKLEEKEKETRFMKDLEIKTKSTIESLTIQIKNTKEKLNKITTKELLEKIKENEKNNALIITKKNTLTLQKEKIKNTILELKEKIAIQKNLLELNNENAKNTKKLESSCPVCKKELSVQDKETLEKELSVERKKIENENKQLTKEAEETEKLNKKIENEIAENEKQKEGLFKETQEIKRLQELSSELTLQEIKKESLEKELENLFKLLKNTDSNEKQIIDLRKTFFETKEKRTKMITEISSGKELLQELKKSVKLIKENESRLKEIEKQIKQNEKTIEKLAIFTSALKSTQSELRNLMIDTINQAMGEIWEKIYPYKDFSNVRISVNEGSYEIEVKQNTGQWQRVEGILSGGERNSVAITLRIVISLVLTQNLGWIILDEPTHNLDSTAVRELSETMRNYLPELIEQIFLITHDKEMENAASGKLYYFERDKENMSITKIE